eukprot:SAG31_NODE_23624_length_500_cov_0.902743_1_plen_63_part_10
MLPPSRTPQRWLASSELKLPLPPLVSLGDAVEVQKQHYFSQYANWVVPGILMAGRYPHVEPDR